MVFEARIEKGALLDVPAYEHHRRGKKWMARIEKDPSSPGGLKREFAPRARGEYFYFLPPEWGVGTPVEFGADYYSGRGKKHPHRWYGWIAKITEDKIVFIEAETATDAINGKEVESE